jgi:hypothetical protein
VRFAAIIAGWVAQLGHRTGVVVLAPAPGRRCGLDNTGVVHSSGAATFGAR